MQRFIREVNTTSRACVLWDLDEETDYIVQVQSIGLYGESQASKKVHFRTLKKSDQFPSSNSSNQGGFGRAQSVAALKRASTNKGATYPTYCCCLLPFVIYVFFLWGFWGAGGLLNSF